MRAGWGRPEGSPHQPVFAIQTSGRPAWGNHQPVSNVLGPRCLVWGRQPSASALSPQDLPTPTGGEPASWANGQVMGALLQPCRAAARAEVGRQEPLISTGDGAQLLPDPRSHLLTEVGRPGHVQWRREATVCVEPPTSGRQSKPHRHEATGKHL